MTFNIYEMVSTELSDDTLATKSYAANTDLNYD